MWWSSSNEVELTIAIASKITKLNRKISKKHENDGLHLYLKKENCKY